MNDERELAREVAEEDEVRSLLRAGDRDLTAPPMPVVGRRAARRGSFPLAAALVGAMLLLVAAFGLARPEQSIVGASPSASDARPSASPTATVSLEAARASAIAHVTASPNEVIRVDHAEAKLVRWSDFETIARTGNPNVDDREVWIVAVSGEVQPRFAQASGPFVSALFVVDAKTSQVVGGAAYGTVWPAEFTVVRDTSGPRQPDAVIRTPPLVVPSDNVTCGIVQASPVVTGEAASNRELRPALRASFGVIPVFRVGLADQPASGTYLCVRYRPGSPTAGFVAYVQPGDPAYMPQSALTPTGFALPANCRYIGQPSAELNADQVAWKVDCGGTNGTIRERLGPELTAQGWTTCGQGAASTSWSKEGRTLALTVVGPTASDPARLTLRQSSICGG